MPRATVARWLTGPDASYTTLHNIVDLVAVAYKQILLNPFRARDMIEHGGKQACVGFVWVSVCNMQQQSALRRL